MKPSKIFILIIAIVFSGCTSNGQQPSNTKPMYGEVQKSDKYQAIDQEFMKNCLAQFGTIDSSVKVQIDNAWSYFYHDDLKTAMKRFNQAWLLDSEYPDSYFGFAALLEMQNNNIEAERFYEIGLEKDKTKEGAKRCYQRIADCKEQLQDFKGTIDAYTKISEISPDNSFAFKKIGFFQMETGNSNEALSAYSKAIQLDPKDAMTYNNRAHLFQTEKKYNEAISDYNEAIKLDPKYISAYVNRGITELEMDKPAAAKKDFEVCVQLDSKDPGLRRFLGIAKLSLGDKLGACEDFELAKQLGDQESEELINQNCKKKK
jgi:tetratricopeptide (TPR) repeat protein